MAANVPIYCGRCGAPLAPGAPFCGTCGTPVAAQAQPAYAAPQAYGAPAAYPPYSYQRAAPAGRGGFVPQIAVAAALVGIIIIVTIGVTAFALRQNTGSHSSCTSNCSPKLVQPLPAAATYKSLKYGFELDYFDRWTVRAQDTSSIELGTTLGVVTVAGIPTTGSLDQVIAGVVQGLPSATYQSVTLVHELKGAHLGDQAGQGAVYSANLVKGSAKAVKIRFAVIAATRGDLTVVMFAQDPADTTNSANGLPEGFLFDYMCTEFRWGS